MALRRVALPWETDPQNPHRCRYFPTRRASACRGFPWGMQLVRLGRFLEGLDRLLVVSVTSIFSSGWSFTCLFFLCLLLSFFIVRFFGIRQRYHGWGRAEQIVGKALQGKRDKAYIFTKCGTLRDEQGVESENLTRESIRHEVEASLRNLRTDYIDLYQFHDPDPYT